MRLTTKGRYAVTAMLDIALHSDAAAVSVADVSSRQGISGAYLEQLFGRLRRSGLLSSCRGPGGGYQLARPLADISVSDIVSAAGEGVDATRCHGAADCQEGVQCLTHDLWFELSVQIDDYLSGISLADLVSRRDVQRIARRQDGQVLQLR